GVPRRAAAPAVAPDLEAAEAARTGRAGRRRGGAWWILRPGLAGGARLACTGGGGRPGHAQGERHRDGAVRPRRAWVSEAVAGRLGAAGAGDGVGRRGFRADPADGALAGGGPDPATG